MRATKLLLIAACFVVYASIAMAADGKIDIKSVTDDGKNVYVTVAGEKLPPMLLAYMSSAPGTNMSFNHHIYDDGTHGDATAGDKVYTCTLLDLYGTLGTKGRRALGTHGKVTSVTLYDEKGDEIAKWKAQ